MESTFCSRSNKVVMWACLQYTLSIKALRGISGIHNSSSVCFPSWKEVIRLLVETCFWADTCSFWLFAFT